MPSLVIAWLEEFVARHHVERPFVKRKRERGAAEAPESPDERCAPDDCGPGTSMADRRFPAANLDGLLEYGEDHTKIDTTKEVATDAAREAVRTPTH